MLAKAKMPKTMLAVAVIAIRDRDDGVLLAWGFLAHLDRIT